MEVLRDMEAYKQEFLDLMALYSDSATRYYLWNENIDTRDNFDLTDDDFIAL